MADGVHFVVNTELTHEPKKSLPNATAKCERVEVELRSGPDLLENTPDGQLLGKIELVTRTDIVGNIDHGSWQSFEAFGTTVDDRWRTPVLRLTKVVSASHQPVTDMLVHGPPDEIFDDGNDETYEDSARIAAMLSDRLAQSRWEEEETPTNDVQNHPRHHHSATDKSRSTID